MVKYGNFPKEDPGLEAQLLTSREVSTVIVCFVYDKRRGLLLPKYKRYFQLAFTPRTNLGLDKLFRELPSYYSPSGASTNRMTMTLVKCVVCKVLSVL